MKVGLGFDAHAFGEGRRLVLGGVQIDHPRGLDGHSDADVLLHAITDALLGAAGLGDIGAMFPSDDETWKDANSLDLLRAAYDHVSVYGLSISNVDATVIAEEPKLAPYISTMRTVIGLAMKLDATAVSIKATTTDGMGFTGRGEGIAALAVVLLE